MMRQVRSDRVDLAREVGRRLRERRQGRWRIVTVMKRGEVTEVHPLQIGGPCVAITAHSGDSSDPFRSKGRCDESCPAVVEGKCMADEFVRRARAAQPS